MRKKAEASNKADPNSILRIICSEVLETHPSLVMAATKLILSVFREPEGAKSPDSLSLHKLPSLLLQMFADDVFVALSCLAMLLPQMKAAERGKLQALILNSSLVQELMQAASENQNDQAVRLIAVNLLLDLWIEELELVCSMDSQIKAQFYVCVESALSHPDKVFKIAVLGQVFTLLDHQLLL